MRSVSKAGYLTVTKPCASRWTLLYRQDAARSGLPPHPLHLVLDNVRSAYNVGSIFRTADTTRCAR